MDRVFTPFDVSDKLQKENDGFTIATQSPGQTSLVVDESIRNVE